MSRRKAKRQKRTAVSHADSNAQTGTTSQRTSPISPLDALRAVFVSKGTLLSGRIVAVEILAGLVVAMVSITYCVGFSALIFDGPLQSGLPTSLWSMLVGTVICSVIIGRLTSIPPLAANLEATTVGMLKVLAVSIVAASQAAGATAGQVITNVMAGITLATLVSGSALYLVGAFRLGQTLRFVPAAVSGGFLCAAGVVVLLASLKLATGRDVVDMVSHVANDQKAALRLAAAIAFFLAYQIARTRFRGPLLMPCFVAAGGIAVYALTRHPILGGMFGDWYPAATQRMDSWLPLSAATRAEVQWPVIASAAPDIIALAIVGVVTLVVRTTSFELALNRRARFDDEFRSHGLANLVAGLFGGTSCAAATGTTKLMSDLGSKTPIAAIVTSIVALLILISDINLTAYFPSPLLAGLLMIVGAGLVMVAVQAPIRQRSWAELAVILLIVGVTLRAGFVSAIVVGFAVSCFLFALSYSRIGVVRRHLTRATFSSHVSRAANVERHLRQSGDRIHIYWLSGYIFFGSSDRLYEQIRSEIEGQSPRDVSHLVIDFSGVTGVDTSAVLSLIKLSRFCAERAIVIAYAALPSRLEQVLTGAGLLEQPDRSRPFESVNAALAWCEEQILPPTPVEPANHDFAIWLAQEIQSERPPAELLSFFVTRTLDSGEALYVEGSPADTIDIIARGTVAIVVAATGKSPLEVRRVARRTVVGEMGFFRQQTRSASVLAVEPVLVYTLKRAAFTRMQKERPEIARAFLVFLIKILSDRLEFANGAITSMVEPSQKSVPAR